MAITVPIYTSTDNQVYTNAYITFKTKTTTPAMDNYKLIGTAYVYTDQADAHIVNQIPLDSFDVTCEIIKYTFNGKLFTFLYTVLKEDYHDSVDVISS